jgi:hypothetical protein
VTIKLTATDWNEMFCKNTKILLRFAVSDGVKNVTRDKKIIYRNGIPELVFHDLPDVPRWEQTG